MELRDCKQTGTNTVDCAGQVFRVSTPASGMPMNSGEVAGWLNILVVILGGAAVIIGIRAKVTELVRTIEELTVAIKDTNNTMNKHETHLQLLRRDVDWLMGPDQPHRRRGGGS